MVDIQTASAGNGRRSHQRELSGKLNLNEAIAARMAVASAPIMLTTKAGCRNRIKISARTPRATQSNPNTIAASESQRAARKNSGYRRRTGEHESASRAIECGVFLTQ